jgi:hypothetical protein
VSSSQLLWAVKVGAGDYRRWWWITDAVRHLWFTLILGSPLYQLPTMRKSILKVLQLLFWIICRRIPFTYQITYFWIKGSVWFNKWHVSLVREPDLS